MTTKLKDPDALLDYVFDWSAWVATGETIASKVVTVPAGITLTSSPYTGTTVTAWVSGGTVGQTYPVACRITTNQGRTDERTLFLQVRQR